MNTTPAVNVPRLGVAVAIALVADLIAYALGNAAGATWRAGQPYTIGVGMVAAATIIAPVVGGAVTALAARWKPAAPTFLAWAGLIFAVVGSPMGYIGGQDLPTGLALGSMHVIVGIAWFLAIKPRPNR